MDTMSGSAPFGAFDVFDRAFLDDPYPTYERLRRDDPVHFDERTGAWLLSRHADVQRAARDWEQFSSAPMNGGVPGLRFLIGSDPPDHTTLRRLVNRPFHPAAIAAMEPRIRVIAAEYVDSLVERGDGDLVTDLAEPLPVTVIAEMLGIPAARRADFKRWSDAMLGGISPDVDVAAAGAATMEMFAYFNEVVAERRELPGEDLISPLVTGKEPLSNQELLMFCMLLLVAGNETTTNLISNLAIVLFERPDVVERLRADPALIPAAVEETLRYDSPVQAIWRLAKDDVELDGGRLPKGAFVTLLYGSANRDEAVFERAAEFDLNRRPTGHLAFGSGIHQCLGAPLARLEARVAFEELIARTAGVERAGDGERARNVIVRGMRHLPVRCQAR